MVVEYVVAKKSDALCSSCWWLVEAELAICLWNALWCIYRIYFAYAGYVPGSSNFGVSYFYCWDNIILILLSLGVQYYGVSFMEMLWGMEHILLMPFTFPMDNSSSPHFHLLFHSSELKIWLIGVLLRSWVFWITWKGRCDVVSNNAHIHLCTMLIDFWMLIVHNMWSIWWSAGFDWCSMPTLGGV